MSRAGRCPKCNRLGLRMKVELFIDAPALFYRRLSNGVLRRGDVKIEGVRWEKALFYCDREGCGYLERL